jgi:putative DNA primase/helicase
MKRWTADSTLRLPRNATTGVCYRGGNVIAFLVAGMQHGYSDSRWVTFKQAKDAGRNVRRGEHHSAVIEYWGSAPQKPKPGEEVIADPDKPGFYRFRSTTSYSTPNK